MGNAKGIAIERKEVVIGNACVCEGNWRLIYHEYKDFLGKKCFKDGKEFIFVGLTVGEDDYYYSVWSKETGITEFLSCVGCLTKGWGFSFEQPTTDVKGAQDEET